MKRDGSSYLGRACLEVVVIVVILLSGALWFSITDKKPENKPINNNPGIPFDSFLTELNLGTAQDIVSSTLAVFSDDYDEIVDLVQTDIIENEYDFHFQLNNYEIIYQDDGLITPLQTNNITNAVDDFEGQTNQTVNDSCVIKYNITTIWNSTSVTFNGEIPAIKIDSQWYLTIFSIGEILEFFDSITPEPANP